MPKKNLLFRLKKNTVVVIAIIAGILISPLLAAEVYFFSLAGDFYYKRSMFLKKHYNKDFIIGKKLEDDKEGKNVIVVKKILSESLIHKLGDESNQSIEYEEKIIFEESTFTKGYTVVFSSWVKTDKRNNTSISIIYRNSKMISAFHPGDGTWKYLTVVSEALFDPELSREITVKLTNEYFSACFKGAVLTLQEIKKSRLPQPRSLYRERFNYKKGKVLRVLAIGGSTTWGARGGYFGPSEPYLTYPSILEQKVMSFPNIDIEVFNLGRCGFRIGLHALPQMNGPKFDKDSYAFGLDDLKPDLVLIAPVWNDLLHEVRYDLVNKPFFMNTTYNDVMEMMERNWFVQRFAFGFFAWNYISQLAGKDPQFIIDENNSKETVDALFKYAIERKLIFLKSDAFNQAKERYKKILFEYCRLWKKSGAKVFLITLPGLVKEDLSGEDILRIHKHLPAQAGRNVEESDLYNDMIYPYIEATDREIITAVSKELNIGLIDISSMYANISTTEKLELFSDLLHFSTKGNLLLSDVIFDAIKRDIPIDEDYVMSEGASKFDIVDISTKRNIKRIDNKAEIKKPLPKLKNVDFRLDPKKNVPMFWPLAFYGGWKTDKELPIQFRSIKQKDLSNPNILEVITGEYEKDHWIAITQRIKTESLKGKTIKLSANLKTEIPSKVGICVYNGISSMYALTYQREKDWRELSTIFTIPLETSDIYYFTIFFQGNNFQYKTYLGKVSAEKFY